MYSENLCFFFADKDVDPYNWINVAFVYLDSIKSFLFNAVKNLVVNRNFKLREKMIYIIIHS